MRTSTAFKIVKSFVSTGTKDPGRYTYICFAIAESFSQGLIGSMDGARLKCIIKTRLGECESLEDWLQEHHSIRVMDYWRHSQKYAAYRNKMQRTRHAWIDSMIAEFQLEDD